MDGVREYSEGFPVDLVLDEATGRIAVMAVNQDGYDVTAIDLLDLVAWLRSGPLPDAVKGVI